ncbi:hypothetical protein, partial [Stenotrophomonas sp. A3_2]|uniref:hypothetical protein n=1 Tax=Stenotrophomonas sp. A3_2 TaxID=3119978 RepID=UPI002FC2BC0E
RGNAHGGSGVEHRVRCVVRGTWRAGYRQLAWFDAGIWAPAGAARLGGMEVRLVTKDLLFPISRALGTIRARAPREEQKSKVFLLLFLQKKKTPFCFAVRTL